VDSGVVRLSPDLTVQHEHFLITGPGIYCAFDSYGCSKAVRHAGGFDEHHPWPLSAGGAKVQDKLILCPNHHRRQHSLFRYLVEQDEAGTEPDYYSVLIHFTASERGQAEASLSYWIAAGRPDINGWPCIAATAA
jgi:hypothetical protein